MHRASSDAHWAYSEVQPPALHIRICRVNR